MPVHGKNVSGIGKEFLGNMLMCLLSAENSLINLVENAAFPGKIASLILGARKNT